MIAEVPHPLDPPSQERKWVQIAAELAVRFAGRAAAHDDSGEVPLQNLTELSGSGLDVALLPRTMGGEGLSYRTLGEITRVLGGACPSTTCIWVRHVGAAVVLVEMSQPEASQFYARELIEGARFGSALPAAGGDERTLGSPECSEAADGAGFVLTGATRIVPGASIVNHLLVDALIGDATARFGISKDGTLTVTGVWGAEGLRASDSQLITFTGTVLRADRRCMQGGPARPDRLVSSDVGLCLGVTSALLAEVPIHAAGRRTSTQAAAGWTDHAIADIDSRLQSCVLYARHANWLADQGSADSSAALVRARQLATSVLREAADVAWRAGGSLEDFAGSTLDRLCRDAQAVVMISAPVVDDVMRQGADLLLGTKERQGD